jgi:hypothetical protein
LQTAGEAGGGGGMAGWGGGGSGGTGGAPAPVTADLLIGLNDFASSNVSGPASAERITVTGMPFENAWRASMVETPEANWAAQLIVPLDHGVAQNDLLHVEFWVRCATPRASGDCATEFIFERAADPWEKSVTFAAFAGATWSQHGEYFHVVADYAPREAHMLFRLGYAEQVIEIGGVIVERIPGP